MQKIFADFQVSVRHVNGLHGLFSTSEHAAFAFLHASLATYSEISLLLDYWISFFFQRANHKLLDHLHKKHLSEYSQTAP